MGSDLGPSRSNDSRSIKDTVGLICKHNLNQFLQGCVASLPIIIFTNDAISSPEDEYLGYWLSWQREQGNSHYSNPQVNGIGCCMKGTAPSKQGEAAWTNLRDL